MEVDDRNVTGPADEQDEPRVGCPYCGEQVHARDLADHVEVQHKRPGLVPAVSFPDSHVQSVPPLMPRSARRGAAVPKRATADSSAEKPTTRRPRARRASAEGGARATAGIGSDREYKLQVPAPDSPPFLTKADFDRERDTKDRPVGAETSPDKSGA